MLCCAVVIEAHELDYDVASHSETFVAPTYIDFARLGFCIGVTED